jgi:hypothetical protein
MWDTFILAAIFFILSWVMAWVILKLPVRYQMIWSATSVWGIFCIVTAVFLFLWLQRPTTQSQAWIDLWVVFAFALPGMAALNYFQRKRWLDRMEESESELDEYKKNEIHRLVFQLNQRNGGRLEPLRESLEWYLRSELEQV